MKKSTSSIAFVWDKRIDSDLFCAQLWKYIFMLYWKIFWNNFVNILSTLFLLSLTRKKCLSIVKTKKENREMDKIKIFLSENHRCKIQEEKTRHTLPRRGSLSYSFFIINLNFMCIYVHAGICIKNLFFSVIIQFFDSFLFSVCKYLVNCR